MSPSLRFRVSATTTDALANRTFNAIPPGGAVGNLWAAGVTATDNFGFSVGARQIMVQGSVVNIEASADVVDSDRDQLLYNELIPPGQLQMPVTVTTESQFLINLAYIASPF